MALDYGDINKPADHCGVAYEEGIATYTGNAAALAVDRKDTREHDSQIAVTLGTGALEVLGHGTLFFPATKDMI